MAVEVHAIDVCAFENGRKVVTVTRPGVRKAPGPGKEGPVEVPFNIGDVMLVDSDGLAVVAPLGFAGATEIARKVIEGDQRTVTDSHSLRALATAVIGFAAQTVAPEPTLEPVSDALATPAELQPEGTTT